MHNLNSFDKAFLVCTLAIYFRVFEEYPLLLAANRDERYNRPSAAPAVLSSTPKILAGRDLRAGGTWLGINEHGLVAAMLNRRNDGGALPAGDVRSRGLLCLDLLGHRSADAAAAFIRDHRAPYSPFTALVADRNEAWVFYNNGTMIFAQWLQPGLHVFSSAAEFDLRCAKAERAHRLFARFGEQFDAKRMDKFQATTGLRSVLADHSLTESSADAGDAVCVHRKESGTVSAGIILLSAGISLAEFFHCDGAPCRNSFGPAQTLEIT